jgi:hypothetical protein
MGITPVLIRMSGEIRREAHYPEPLGGECRGGREVERNEYSTQGDISHVIAGAHLIIDKMKGGEGQVEESKRRRSYSRGSVVNEANLM